MAMAASEAVDLCEQTAGGDVAAALLLAVELDLVSACGSTTDECNAGGDSERRSQDACEMT